jgi:hypothetical protein
MGLVKITATIKDLNDTVVIVPNISTFKFVSLELVETG